MIELLSDAHWFSYMVLFSQFALLGIQIHMMLELNVSWMGRKLEQRTREYERYQMCINSPIRLDSTRIRKVPSLDDHYAADDDEQPSPLV
ncbi:hypothetical protein JCM19037_4905 [Geomicrobium sp. JCM 19037]|uniref:hypothetical protein n=1 Tax=unclassified Geomicrobium TaxID=2628951 RepID=UPI00045F40A6|nr:hypothetical protein [Geomicrobium sp. JCM 19037]GAK06303.1 hypothetical protein JCM19037_4905 [Geomicrobium sp. JCM 19037]